VFFKKRTKEQPAINASSMADIAFLLLIFFLVTTTIVSDKGIPLILPPKAEKNTPVDVSDRNVFKVILNSSDLLLVEDKPMELSEVRKKCKEFLSNNGKNVELSESPADAIVSFRADRGTSYEMYLIVLDELKGAYHELRAEKLNISVEEYLQLKKENPNHAKALDYAQKVYPMQLSIAEPTKYGGK